MSSEKRAIQNFSNFRGLDVRSSDLTRPINAAKEAKNYIIEQDFSLGGEKGLHMFADYFDGEPIVGMHNYIYKDPDTGQEAQELLALGKELYRLASTTFNIQYSGSDLWGYDFLVDDTDGELRLRLWDDGAVVLDYNIGTGLEDDTTGTTKLSTLEAQIDAVTDFASVSTTADTIVAAAFPLKSEYDLTSSDNVLVTVYYWEEVESHGLGSIDTTQGIFSPYVNDHDDISLKPPHFLNKNNVCYIACDGRMPLMKYDGAAVYQAGSLGLIAEDVEIAGAANSPALVGSFRYYLRTVRKDAKSNFIYGAGYKTDVITTTSGQAPEIGVFESASTTLGLEHLGRVVIGSDSTTNTSTNTVTLGSAIDDGDFEAYGHEKVQVGDIVYLLGNCTPSVVERRITAVDRAAKQITFDGPAVTLSSAGATFVYWNNHRTLGGGYIDTNSAQASVSAISTSAISDVAEGMWLFFENEQEWFKVTDVSGSTVTIDGLVTTPSGSARIATNVALEVWRTEDEGTEKFYLSKTFSDLGSTNFDTTADADLGAELVFPAKEPDHLREFPSVIAQHQGVLVAAGGKTRAGRLVFEDFEFQEGFPAATNFYDVPSQDAGIITALWSDTYDQLAVFKDTAYYSVVGSFRDEIAILNTIANTENDLGVSCQSSLLRIRKGLNIGVGPLGFIAFSGGEVDYEFTKQLDSEFLSGNVGEVLSEASKLRTHRAIAVNDKFKNQAYFLIPAFDVDSSDSTVHQGANENSKMFILDYSERTWTRRAFPSDLSVGSSGLVAFPFYPTAGMVVYEDRLLMMSCAYDSTVGNGDHTDFNSYCWRRKEREVLPTGITDYRQDYADNHAAIEYDYKSQWHILEPLEDGLFHWLKIYSIPETDFVPFDLQIRTYLDFDEDTVIDNSTISFTSSTKKHLFKLKANRGEAIMVRLTTNAVLEKPTITGFEVVLGDADGELEGVR